MSVAAGNNALLHRLSIALVAVLVLGAGEVHLAGKLPSSAGFWNWLHIGAGVLASLVGFMFFSACCRNGLWKNQFPWFVGVFGPTVTDLKGLAKGRFPTGGGQGLLSAIQGIGLVLMLLAGATGLMWLFTQGSGDAMFWRGQHILWAQGFVGFLIVHLIASLGAVIDLIRS